MTAMPKRRVLVPIADGTEEIEAVCIIDVLRRAGAEVTVFHPALQFGTLYNVHFASGTTTAAAGGWAPP